MYTFYVSKTRRAHRTMRFLKIITFVENMFSVYRNYMFYNKVTRKIILLRIMLEIIFIIVNMVYQNERGDLITNLICYNLSTTNSIVILLLAIYNAGPYKKLAMYFKSMNLYFPNERDSKKKSEVVQKMLVAMALCYYLIKINAVLYYMIYYTPPIYVIDKQAIKDLFIIICITSCDFRFIIEFLVMCCGVNDIAEQLIVIVLDIDKEILTIYSETGEVKAVCEHASVTISQDCKRRLRQFDNWSAAYATIKKCSELCNNIFGFQVSVVIFVKKNCIIITAIHEDKKV